MYKAVNPSVENAADRDTVEIDRTRAPEPHVRRPERYTGNQALLGRLARTAGSPIVLRKCSKCEEEEKVHTRSKVARKATRSAVLSPKLEVSHPNDPSEIEADFVAEAVVNRKGLSNARRWRTPARAAASILQLKCAACEKEDREKAIVQRQADDAASPEPEPETGSEPAAAGAFLVDDDVAEPAPVQMRKSDFLAQLRAAVCDAVDQALKGTDSNSDGCPWVERVFTTYGSQTAAQIEAAVHRYLPDAGAIQSAAGYIPIIVARVSDAAKTWAQTGKVTGLPEGVSPDLAVAPPESPSAPASVSGQVSAKSRNGASPPLSVTSLSGQLGGGRPMDTSVRGRMETAFGMDFSSVRVHTDQSGARLSDQLSARAFTLGNHIAFASGEYQPGGVLGDALIAHELAHVVQQGHAKPGAEPNLEPETAGEESLEADADDVAYSATLSLWQRARSGIRGIARKILPRLKSGLRIQRCDHTLKKCPSNRHWGVVGAPAGGGSFGCLCRWECLSGAPPTPASMSSGPSLQCPPDQYCAGPPPVDEVGPDYFKQGEGKLGYGAQAMSGDPLTGDAVCLCIPPDNLVGAQTPPPIKTGFDPTNFYTGPMPGDKPGGGAHETQVEGKPAEVRPAEPHGEPPKTEQKGTDVKPTETKPTETKPTDTKAGEKPVDPLEGVTPETKEALRKPDKKPLVDALARDARAAKALKRCTSACYPEFAKPEQIDEIEGILKKAEDAGIHVDYDTLTTRLRDKSIQNAGDLENAIQALRVAFDYQMELGADIRDKTEIDARPTFRDESPLATELRNRPGVASGGENLPVAGSKWIQEGKVGIFPKQIADQLRGQSFNNFGDFREAFWKAVAADPVLGHIRQKGEDFGWTAANLDLMKKGRAPFVISSQKGSGEGRQAKVFNLDHKQAIKNTGGVYDMSNIDIVSPGFHEQVGE